MSDACLRFALPALASRSFLLALVHSVNPASRSLRTNDGLALSVDDLELRFALRRLDAFFLPASEKILESLRPTDIAACLRLFHPVSDCNQLAVQVLESRMDAICNRFLNLSLDEAGGQRHQGLVQQIMLRVANAELEGVDLDLHALNLEDRALIFISRYQMDRSRQTIPADENIGDTRVHNLGETSLLAVVDRDVPHVRLHLGELEHKFVMVLIGYRVVGTELQEVVCIKRNDIREQIAALKSQVLDDKVDRVIGILDTWDRNIPNLRDGQPTCADTSRHCIPCQQVLER